MADAIPTEKQAMPQSTVVVEKDMTLWQALKEAGWWTRFDWIMLVLLVLTWLAAAEWVLFGKPQPVQVCAALLVAVCLKLVWLISLVFRCSYFVLKLNADVATLPQASARIAVAYLSGKK